jgi:hypothetical protein
LHEIKHDGFRIMALRDAKMCAFDLLVEGDAG